MHGASARRRLGKVTRVTLLIASTATFLFFSTAQIWWWSLPHSDFYPSFAHWSLSRRTVVEITDGVAIGHQTRALEENRRYPNIKNSGWRACGFGASVTWLVNYPRWVSHGDNATIEWGPMAEWGVRVPNLFVMAVTSILPIRWLVELPAWYRRRRKMRGLCPRCGYDIRATPELCPECGTVLANEASGAK